MGDYNISINMAGNIVVLAVTHTQKSVFFLSYWFLLAGFVTLSRFCFSTDSHPTIFSSAGITCLDSS